MPAYDRPMEIRSPRRSDMRVGAVLKFKAGTSGAKAQRFLDELYRRGILEVCATAHEYDTQWGSGPVWYIP